jgi:hypothetical protein
MEGNNQSLPKSFFKPLTAELRSLIKDQIKHVDHRCLFNPPNLLIHRKNPITGKIYSCRETSSIENVNLYLDALTGKAIGIAQADRTISTFFEIAIERAKVTHLGQHVAGGDAFNYRTEKLAMINSLTTSAGLDVPFDLSLPPQIKDAQKVELGFDKTWMELTIAHHYTWKGMRKTVKHVCLRCDSCQHNKRGHLKLGKLNPKDHEVIPWETVCIDLIGPYPIGEVKKDRTGKVISDTLTTLHAMTMVDPAAGWIEIVWSCQ